MKTYDYHPGEDVEIIVGDEKQDKFFPRMKIKRWDNEVNFSVGIITEHQGTDASISDKVVWKDGQGLTARFYEKKDAKEFEFEIELASKPASNVIELSIETKGLNFYYQPALTREEKNEVMIGGDGKEYPMRIQAEDMVGSYAVYHKTMTGNYLGGKNYRAGKAFHIYRPKVVDMAGSWSWAEMEIDVERGILAITIDQKWIDNAVYPVVVDPTFGVDPLNPPMTYDLAVQTNMLYGALHTSPAGVDTVQDIMMYVKLFISGCNWKGVILLHSTLNIIPNGIGGATSLTTSSYTWKQSSFGTDPTLTPSTEYLLAVINNSGMWGYVAYDDGDADILHKDYSNSYSSPQNMGAATHGNSLMAIYATYTAAVGGVAPTSIFIGPFGGPFGGPIQ